MLYITNHTLNHTAVTCSTISHYNLDSWWHRNFVLQFQCNSELLTALPWIPLVYLFQSKEKKLRIIFNFLVFAPLHQVRCLSLTQSVYTVLPGSCCFRHTLGTCHGGACLPGDVCTTPSVTNPTTTRTTANIKQVSSLGNRKSNLAGSAEHTYQMLSFSGTN